MDEPALSQLLEDVRTGVLSPDEAVLRLKRLPFADLGFRGSIITVPCDSAWGRLSMRRGRRLDIAWPW